MSKRDFTIVKKIGTGSFSNVYKVKRTEDDQIYAMKEINYTTLKQDDKQGVLNEIRLLASIKSDYVVRYMDAFLDDKSKTLCIIMEYADRGDLQGLVNYYKQRKTDFPEEEIWNVVTCVSKGLRDLHKLKIIHRDIKSANLFVSRDRKVKIGDMNVSKLQQNGYARTQTGTPYYCPPEIWQDKPYDSKCDIWSFGIVLYELCCGKPPFTAQSMEGLYQKIKQGKYVQIPDRYSKELSTLISKMLKISPAQRISAQEVVDNHLNTNNMTLMRSNSNPIMLNTIKVPKDIFKLKSMLPQKRYRNAANGTEDVKVNGSVDNIAEQLRGLDFKGVVVGGNEQGMPRNASVPSRNKNHSMVQEKGVYERDKAKNAMPTAESVEKPKDYSSIITNHYNRINQVYNNRFSTKDEEKVLVKESVKESEKTLDKKTESNRLNQKYSAKERAQELSLNLDKVIAVDNNVKRQSINENVSDSNAKNSSNNEPHFQNQREMPQNRNNLVRNPKHVIESVSQPQIQHQQQQQQVIQPKQYQQFIQKFKQENSNLKENNNYNNHSSINNSKSEKSIQDLNGVDYKLINANNANGKAHANNYRQPRNYPYPQEPISKDKRNNHGVQNQHDHHHNTPSMNVHPSPHQNQNHNQIQNTKTNQRNYQESINKRNQESSKIIAESPSKHEKPVSKIIFKDKENQKIKNLDDTDKRIIADLLKYQNTKNTRQSNPDVRLSEHSYHHEVKHSLNSEVMMQPDSQPQSQDLRLIKQKAREREKMIRELNEKNEIYQKYAKKGHHNRDRRPESKEVSYSSSPLKVHDRLYQGVKRPSSRDLQDSKLYGILYSNKYHRDGIIKQERSLQINQSKGSLDDNKEINRRAANIHKNLDNINKRLMSPGYGSKDQRKY